MNKLFFVLSWLSLFVSCETKDQYDDGSVNFTKGDLNVGKFYSDLEFAGVQSVSTVTDSTANIFWDSIDGAQMYYIYDASNDNPILLQKLLATETSIKLNFLTHNTTYKIMVRVLDDENLLDNNEATVEFTTDTLPEPPSFISRSNPSKALDIINTPSFLIAGVNPGDTVQIYSDACITKVGEAYANFSFVVIETDELPFDNTYTFHTNRINHLGVNSPCSTVNDTYEVRTCPDGYVYVPENQSILQDEFCVMQFEAKAWQDVDSDNIVDSGEVDSDGCNEAACTTANWGTSSFVPGSSAEGKPWRMIDLDTAKSACQLLGDNYDLISNLEWMTIAMNIESDLDNWVGGVVGAGCLSRGNNGVADGCGYAHTDLDDRSIATRIDTEGRLELTNGNQIWDLSGNVSEWVDFGKDDLAALGPKFCNNSWQEFTSEFCTGLFDTDHYMPANPAGTLASSYDSSFGLGRIEGGTGGAITRGGDYESGDYAGLFSFSLAADRSYVGAKTGFRCVYRIPQ